MSENVPYADIERLLTTKLHFRAHRVSGAHVTFTRQGSKARIVLRPIGGRLPARQFAYLRDTLDLHGILSREEFEASLRKPVRSRTNRRPLAKD